MKKTIGYISYTHGLDGKVKIVPMVSKNEFEDCIKNDDIFLNNKTEQKLKIDIFAYNGKIFICKIDGICDIDSAKNITKNEIFINTREDDNFIDPEIIQDFDVYLNNDKKKYGKVIDFGDYGNGNLIEVLTKKNKSEFYKCDKKTISKIDEINKFIVIDLKV